MSDGSLSNGGFEIISHPQSFNYIMANKDKIKLVWDKLIDLGYVSHDSTHCGLHFHITRPTDDEIINRLWFILEFYKKEIITLSRRSSGQIEQWCNFLSDMLNDNERKKLKSYEYVKGTNKKVKRYMALNNTNEKTKRPHRMDRHSARTRHVLSLLRAHDGHRRDQQLHLFFPYALVLSDLRAYLCI